MTTSFLKLKKELKSFAKRVKNFKYTDKLLIVFLLTGAVIGIENNLLAEIADDEITNQIKQINISTANFRKNFKKAKNESNRLIKGANLELIQLMEQGDHVIKPIWLRGNLEATAIIMAGTDFTMEEGTREILLTNSLIEAIMPLLEMFLR